MACPTCGQLPLVHIISFKVASSIFSLEATAYAVYHHMEDEQTHAILHTLEAWPCVQASAVCPLILVLNFSYQKDGGHFAFHLTSP